MNSSASSTLTSELIDDETLLACRKRSFLKLPLEIDIERLKSEFDSIPADAWGGSLWDAHCSIDMLLLRGGASGSAEDFTTYDVKNNPLVETLPYIGWLLSPEGPFGGTSYAFIFRTKPNGITRMHRDDNEAWLANVRVHIPIVSNPGAVLMSEGRAKHFPVGEAWTFDNQTVHSVVNGDTTRVHLIIDVPPNPKFAELMRNAEFDAGEEDPERWETTGWNISAFRFAECEPLSRKERAEMGLRVDGFSARITGVSRKAQLMGDTGLRVGDIVYKVNGVDESHVARTAIEHIYQTMKPKDRVVLAVMRGGRPLEVKTRLVAPGHYSVKHRLRGMVGALHPAKDERAVSGY